MAEGIFLRLMCKDSLVLDTILAECKTPIAKIRYESATRAEFLCDLDGILAIGQEYARSDGYPYLEFREEYNFSPFLKVYLHPNRTLLYYNSVGSCIRETALSESDFRPIRESVENAGKPATPPKDPPRKDPPKKEPPPKAPPKTDPPVSPSSGDGIGGYLIGIALVAGLFAALISWLLEGPLAFMYGIRTEILDVTRILLCVVVPVVGILIQLYQSRNVSQVPPQQYRKFRILHMVLAMLCFLCQSGVLYRILLPDASGTQSDTGMILFVISCLTGLVFSLPSGIYMLFTLNSNYHGAYWDAAIRMLQSVSLIIFLTAFACQVISHFTLAYVPGFGEVLGLALGIVIYYLGSALGRKCSTLPFRFVHWVWERRRKRAN